MTRRARLWAAPAAVAIAAVVAFAVTRRGDEGTPVTHARLVTEVDAACARLARGNLGLEPPPRPYDVQATEFFDGVAANVSAARERLAELEPTAEDEAALDSYVETLRLIALRAEEAAGAASLEQDSEVAALIFEIRALVRGAIAQERALGVCRGETSTRTSIAAAVIRTRENPLTETGPLVP